MGKVKNFLGKVKTFVINHKKAVIAVVAVIGILAIGISAFLAIRQATIKSALEAQVGGKWYMSVDMNEFCSSLSVDLVKIENGKYTHIQHFGVLPQNSYDELGSLDAHDYRVDGDSEAGWIRCGEDGYASVFYAKGENGEYLLYEYESKTRIFKEVKFSDYEKALTMFSCPHKNVVRSDLIKHTCLDCGRVWVER